MVHVKIGGETVPEDVIRSVMGTKRTVVFVLLVVVMATVSGLLFGWYMS